VTAAGPDAGHERAKSALRAGDPSAAASLWKGALAVASRAGIRERLEGAAKAIGFQPR